MSSKFTDLKPKMKFGLFVLFCCFLAICGAKKRAEKIPVDFRIVSGQDAAEGQAPYMCSLQKQKLNLCGCAIISDKYVLTAAHCVYGKTENMLEVLVGTNDVTKGGQFYQIEKFSVHKEFAGPKRYDIATVRVQGKIEFNANVQPIELLLTDDVPDGSEVTFTGFGRLSQDGVRPNHLQTFDAKTLTTQSCKKTMLGPIINESHICIYSKLGKGQGVCNGDSGGPLVSNGKLLGLASIVVVPCAAGKPDIFVKVSYFRDWIKENTQ